MGIYRKSESIWLFMGDIAIFLLSLFGTLLIRYGDIPSKELFLNHLEPFSFVFVVSVAVFFIVGLYEKHTLILKSKLPSKIISAQAANVLIAVLFFYLIPYFGITPKTNLFIYLILSSFLLISWRLYGPGIVSHGKRQNGLLIASGQEMHELFKEVNGNSRYNLFFVSSMDLESADSLDFQTEIIQRVYSEDIHVIVVDAKNQKIEPILPHLYNLIFSHVRFVDMHRIYEDIFDRVPLSLVEYSWFLENISSTVKVTHDFLKRLMDILISFTVGTASLLLYPFIALAIYVEDGRPIFFSQRRVGQNNRLISIVKFRSMKKTGDEKVTKVGRFLRGSRLDELPQLWSVLDGSLSLIGPRPEVPALAKHYEEEVPYYSIRHLVKPGISGWAQIYHDEPAKFLEADKDSTKVKLSYDLYYLKNRSFFLDIKIALKTLKVFFSRTGK